MSNPRLTPTSYLVLGLLAREGPSTPYDLKRHAQATLGNFWSFPHTLLYSEPPRLLGLGLVGEERETAGRRRRVFAITPAGEAALAEWLDRPSDELAELRDPALLQLFFSDLASPSARVRLAEKQLAIHRATLARYRDDQGLERRVAGPERGQRTVDHWRGETLPMGIAYESGAVDFWGNAVARARAALGEENIESGAGREPAEPTESPGSSRP